MKLLTLRLEFAEPIAHITLSRPQEGNRVDDRMLRELSDACETIAANDAIRVTLLTADGPDFCFGWDASVGEDLPLDPFSPIAGLPMPVVVALNGAVLSAGLELALSCDVRVAAADARFALPEVSLGTLPRAGGTQRLPRVVGRSLATSMLLLGDELDATVAYRAGLVSRVFPTAELQSGAESLVRRIAANGPTALRFAKEAVHHGADLSLDQALQYELDLSVILQTTEDRAEGVKAFLEKRPPRFENR